MFHCEVIFHISQCNYRSVKKNRLNNYRFDLIKLIKWKCLRHVLVRFNVHPHLIFQLLSHDNPLKTIPPTHDVYSQKFKDDSEIFFASFLFLARYWNHRASIETHTEEEFCRFTARKQMLKWRSISEKSGKTKCGILTKISFLSQNLFI